MFKPAPYDDVGSFKHGFTFIMYSMYTALFASYIITFPNIN